MIDRVQLTDVAFYPHDHLRDFIASAVGAGAVASFTGLVRGETASGDVHLLHLQAYSPLTENSMQQAITDARARWPVQLVQIIHRIGDMRPGDAIVFVAVSAAHRRAAFLALDFLMDYLKTEAVFWKRETGTNGAIWIEPRAEDYADRAGWAALKET
jgi:molybdopterin synthase catalytic subunit